MTAVMTDLTVREGDAYPYCEHERCDLGVNGDGKVVCSGLYCADMGVYDPPADAYWFGEEDNR